MQNGSYYQNGTGAASRLAQNNDDDYANNGYRNSMSYGNGVQNGYEDIGFDSGMSINVSEPERVVSLIGGGALTALGFVITVSRNKLAGLLLAAIGGELIRTGVTGNSLFYRAAKMNHAVTGYSNQVSIPHEQGYRLEYAVLVDRSARELYDFWRNFENLPKFMQHLEKVTVTDDTHSHWVAKAPAGMKVEWDAELINETTVPDQLIAWRSLEGSQVPNAGSVQFRAINDRSTEVRVNMKYDLPGGAIGAAITKLFGEDPEQQVKEDMNRFKALMETSPIVPKSMQPPEPGTGEGL